jgi:hypothetical protein
MLSLPSKGIIPQILIGKSPSQGREKSEHIITENCELDSHVDTSVAGPNFTVIEYTDLVCYVSPFSKFYAHCENVPIVKAATAYDDEKRGITYILVLGQALYFGKKLK